MRRNRLVRALVCAFFFGTVFTGCMNDGGWNQNERQAGGGDDGVSVELGEIAIDPTGQYLISRSNERLIYADLDTGETSSLDGLSHTARVTFDHEGTSIFLTRGTSRLPGNYDDFDYADADTASGRLIRYDVAEHREIWSQPLTLSLDWDDDGLTTFPWLEVTEDDRYLVVTYSDRVQVVDASSGRVIQTFDVPGGVVDVDVTPDQQRVVITTQHSWQGDIPRTVLEIHGLATSNGSPSSQIDITVPNCSSELVISHNGQHAFLAPTRCQKDPVSVIDLEAGRFVRNLPGFGPVALAADGSLAVAFIDSSNIDESLFDDPQQIPSGETRYHLMLINAETLRFDVIALGDNLPRYAITPDGALLLIDADTLWSDGRIRLLDVAARELVPVLGAGLQLSHYAMTRDSSKVFLLDNGLFTIDLPRRVAQSEPIAFTPTNLNLSPDDALLVLREDDTTLWLYDTQALEIVRSIDLSAQYER